MSKIKDKFLIGVIFFSYISSMLFFELMYCNGTNCIKFIQGDRSLSYNFSMVRIIMYVLFFVVLCIFRKALFYEAITQFQNSKFKRVITYVYSSLSVIAIILGVCFFINNPLYIKSISAVLIAILMGEVFIVGLSSNIIKNIIITTFSLGLMFCIITDFNHAIDEKKHFATAFNIAFGNFNYVKEPITDKKIEELPHLIKYTEIDELLEKKYVPEITNDVNISDIPSTPATYNCIEYLFPAIGIWLAKSLGGCIIDLYILGRLFNLILYCILICIAIKLLPHKKNLFFVIFLMPISLVFAGTFSVDGFCIGVVSIFIAYCMKIKNESSTLNLKQAIILLILVGFMLTAKSMAYLMVCLVFLILPLKNTLKNNKKFIPLVVLGLIIAMISVMFYIVKVKNSNDAPDTRGGDNVDMNRQIDYVLNNPVADVKLAFNQIRDTFGNLNWYQMLQEDKLFSSSAQYILVPLLVFMVYVAITEDESKIDLKDKIVFITSAIFTFAMTSMVLYVSFTSVGSEHIAGYQARYIIPILPLILMCFETKNIKVLDMGNRNYKIALISGIFVMLTVFQSILEI